MLDHPTTAVRLQAVVLPRQLTCWNWHSADHFSRNSILVCTPAYKLIAASQKYAPQEVHDLLAFDQFHKMAAAITNVPDYDP